MQRTAVVHLAAAPGALGGGVFVGVEGGTCEGPALEGRLGHTALTRGALGGVAAKLVGPGHGLAHESRCAHDIGTGLEGDAAVLDRALVRQTLGSLPAFVGVEGGALEGVAGGGGAAALLNGAGFPAAGERIRQRFLPEAGTAAEEGGAGGVSCAAIVDCAVTAGAAGGEQRLSGIQ